MVSQVNKAQVKTRLTQEGRFEEFKRKREEFRGKGYVGDACWLHALRERDSEGRPFADPLGVPNGLTLPPSTIPRPRGYASPSAAASADGPSSDSELSSNAPDAAIFQTKGKAQYADAVNWVATNLHLKNVNEADAPNGIAVNLRRDAIAFPRVREIFWASIFPKLLPSEKEITHMRRVNAKNEDLADASATYERALIEMEKEDAAQAASEPTVSAEATTSRESDDGY